MTLFSEERQASVEVATWTIWQFRANMSLCRLSGGLKDVDQEPHQEIIWKWIIRCRGTCFRALTEQVRLAAKDQIFSLFSYLHFGPDFDVLDIT